MTDDRVYWYKVVREFLEQNSIPWTMWDYHGGFGLFQEGGHDLFEHDLNVSLLQAIGFNVPEQAPFIVRPDTTGFIIYDEFIGTDMYENGYGGI